MAKFFRVVLMLILVVLCSTAMAANIRDYADDSSDWGPAIQRAIDNLVDDDGKWPDMSGGIIEFPRGRYPVKTPIIVRCPNVALRGCGGPKTYACTIEWQGENPNDALFTMVSKDKPATERSYGFKARGIYFHAKKSGTAFRFSPPDQYLRPFKFADCAIKYFAKAFEFQNAPGGSSTYGGLAVLDSELMYNGQVIDATSGRLNEFQFQRCLIEKNGLQSEGWEPQYAIDLKGGSNGAFYGCVLEAQPLVIRVRQYYGFRLEGCRFERNLTLATDQPPCLFEDCNGVYVQCMNRLLSGGTGPDKPPIVELRRCRDYRVEPMAGAVTISREWEN